MRTLGRLITGVFGSAALLLVSVQAPLPAVGVGLTAQPRTATVAGWTVELDQSQLQSTLGSRFSFVSTLRNDTGRSQPGTIAYLNVLSTKSSVYVDPEDWSSNRTRFLGDVQTGETRQVTWNLQAVNSGSFVIFVVVTSASGGHDVVSSPALRLTIADQRRLNPTGILPVTLAVPAVLTVGMGWVRQRRRRLR